MRWLWAIFLPLILNLAGCGSSGNSNAPVSTAPHESTWVTYHRNDIVNAEAVAASAAATSAVVDGVLISEHVFQCRVCHGDGLMGVNAVPACLNCHVLDPVRYPTMCYSCHGGYPVMNPQSWYSTVVTAPQNQYSTTVPKRPVLPLDTAFIGRVRSTPAIHLKHAAVSLNTSGDITSDKCAVCHGEKNARGEIHHVEVMNRLNMGCLGPLPYGCHTFNMVTFTLVTPDCSACHNDLNLPP
ncbi:MAG: hypothetical protein A2X82_12200 [Geobacteraceae bacterium GWC2_55_20]|nr:MAG: hypothetical protein A2X82_12200 [Geobacteraceae bacterium GWC2_55_20]HCE69388.1 hypothetical protein [Geobacter sp.]